MRVLASAVFGLVLALPASAQGTFLGSGQIGIVSLPQDRLFLADPSALPPNVVAMLGVTGGFLGTGQTHAILWDPWQPDSFLVAGDGFVGRVTLTAPGQASYTLITQAVGSIAQMAFQSPTRVVATDSQLGAVRVVYLLTGQVTSLIIPAPPAWSAPEAIAVDQRTGLMYIGGQGSIVRASTQNGVASLTTVAGGLPGTVTGLATDPWTTDLFATVRNDAIVTGNRVLRVSVTGTVSDLVVPGILDPWRPNALDVMPDGSLAVGVFSPTGAGPGIVFQVPRAGGHPVPVANIFPQPTVTGIAVVGGLSHAPFTLDVALSAGALTLSVQHLPPGTAEGFTGIASVMGPSATGLGPVFGILPDTLTLQLLAQHPAPQPGNPFHFVAGAPGAYPGVPFVAPPPLAASLAGVTLDFVVVGLGPDGTSFTNVRRQAF